MRNLLLATTALAVFSCAAAEAAEAVSTVDELVITRLPARLDEITGARVIDRAEIEARQSVLLTDLLSTVPGVGVSRSGAFGGVSNISIRGANADKTLVLVDGVPQNDPSQPQGNFDSANLQLADVERVEILSGPQGSLWGSEAIGGVISVTTRELDGLAANVEGGAFNTFRTYVGAGVNREAYAISASVAGYDTDGISKADKRDGATEKDGYTTVTASLKGRVAASDTLSFDGAARYTRSDTDTDGYPFPSFVLGDTTDRYRSREWSGFGRAHLKNVLGLDHTFSVSLYDIKRQAFSDFPYAYDADRQVYRWTAEHGAVDAPFSFIVGAEREETSADLDGRDTIDLSATSAFGVGRVRVGDRLTLTGSLRYDDPDKVKGHATGRISAAGVLGGGFTLTASAGTGFKTPTISQLVCDFCSPAGPAFGLKPEKAEGYDLRLGWTAPDGRYSAAITGYRLSVHDQISYGIGRYVNIARARSTGIEAEAEAQLTDSLRLKVGYSVMDAVDRTTGASLLRVPDHSGSAALFWTQDQWSGALTVRGESSQTDTARNGFSLATRKSFVTADLAGAYALNESVSFTARIENLADEHYQETLGYGEPGRAVYVGVRLRR